MKPKEHSFIWLSLVVVVPLILLAVLAAIGIRAQLAGAANAAREQARTAADSLLFRVTTVMEGKYRLLPEYPDPPAPGPAGAGDRNLDEDDPATLRAIRDDAGESLSAAGLPRRALAAMRVLEITREKADAEKAIEVATGPAVSILTDKILLRVDEMFPGLARDGLEVWRKHEEVKQALAPGPPIGVRGEWRGSFFARRTEQGIRYFELGDLEEAIDSAKPDLPPWAVARINRAGEAASALGSVPLPYGEGLLLKVVATSTSAYESIVRGQVRWTIALLVLAIAGALTGLWIIRRVYERERRLNAMKSDFVASVSHELRAPIASIRLMADALEEGKIESTTAADFHRLISREGARLSTLIENVLDFARIEQGKKQWHLEEADLREVVRGTVSLMEPLAAEKGIRLTVETPADSSARIDADATRQALVNLIDNAIKFSPGGTRVDVRLTQEENFRKISITDEGPGIPEAEHVRIFEKFHRLGGELRRETQGTGIGLSVVKAIAAAHGGRVVLDSAPGKGSTFIFTISAV